MPLDPVAEKSREESGKKKRPDICASTVSEELTQRHRKEMCWGRLAFQETWFRSYLREGTCASHLRLLATRHSQVINWHQTSNDRKARAGTEMRPPRSSKASLPHKHHSLNCSRGQQICDEQSGPRESIENCGCGIKTGVYVRFDGHTVKQRTHGMLARQRAPRGRSKMCTTVRSKRRW